VQLDICPPCHRCDTGRIGTLMARSGYDKVAVSICVKIPRTSAILKARINGNVFRRRRRGRGRIPTSENYIIYPVFIPRSCIASKPEHQSRIINRITKSWCSKVYRKRIPARCEINIMATYSIVRIRRTVFEN